MIGNFIADFYCANAKLVVELDGSQHYTKEGMLCDREQTKYFQKYDILIKRYSNLDVDKHFEKVCEDILLTVENRVTTR